MGPQGRSRFGGKCTPAPLYAEKSARHPSNSASHLIFPSNLLENPSFGRVGNEQRRELIKLCNDCPTLRIISCSSERHFSPHASRRHERRSAQMGLCKYYGPANWGKSTKQTLTPTGWPFNSSGRTVPSSRTVAALPESVPTAARRGSTDCCTPMRPTDSSSP